MAALTLMLNLQPRSRVQEDLARFKSGGVRAANICCRLNGKATTTSFRVSGKDEQTLCRFALSGSPVGDVEGPPMNSVKDRKLVPQSDPPSTLDVNNLYEILFKSNNIVVLTGAGISTESGIPDYRSEKGAYSIGFKAITHQDFIASSSARTWYWACSDAGLKTLNKAKPGVAHNALASLEKANRIRLIITQNIDGLHHRAGSSPLELHGTIYTICCTNVDCGYSEPMESFQEKLKALNPKWVEAIESLDYDGNADKRFGMKRRHDDDIKFDENSWEEGFLIPTCPICSGVLKPDVVFFGDFIPKERKDIALEAAKGCDTLLVLGSSLVATFVSDLVSVAKKAGATIVIVNIGKTEADSYAHLKINANVGEILARLLNTGSIRVPAISDSEHYDTKYAKYMDGNCSYVSRHIISKQNSMCEIVV